VGEEERERERDTPEEERGSKRDVGAHATMPLRPRLGSAVWQCSCMAVQLYGSHGGYGYPFVAPDAFSL